MLVVRSCWTIAKTVYAGTSSRGRKNARVRGCDAVYINNNNNTDMHKTTHHQKKSSRLEYLHTDRHEGDRWCVS